MPASNAAFHELDATDVRIGAWVGGVEFADGSRRRHGCMWMTTHCHARVLLARNGGVGALLGLLVAVVYGSSDFAAGLASRRMGAVMANSPSSRFLPRSTQRSLSCWPGLCSASGGAAGKASACSPRSSPSH